MQLDHWQPSRLFLVINGLRSEGLTFGLERTGNPLMRLKEQCLLSPSVTRPQQHSRRKESGSFMLMERHCGTTRASMSSSSRMDNVDSMRSIVWLMVKAISKVDIDICSYASSWL